MKRVVLSKSMNVSIYCGDCTEVMSTMPSKSIDAIITDPPYGINLLGNKWDCQVPGINALKECFRVLKEGCYLVAFSGRRTYHALARNVINAGFVFDKMLFWTYGEGAPKSGNLSKKMDKLFKPGEIGKLRCMVNPFPDGRKRKQRAAPINGVFGASAASAASAAKLENGKLEVREFVSDEARKWEGWQASLKPAFEPIIVAYKPPMIGSKNNLSLIYCAKARNKDRDVGVTEFTNVKGRADVLNFHPSVKPSLLMRILCNEYTPARGIVLDPWMGSGSTGKSAVLEGLGFCGIENREDYFRKLCQKRIGFELDHFQQLLFE